MNPNHTQFHTLQNYWTAPNWLGKRMLFLSGPRQVGKTTLVTSTLCTDKRAYFNWDYRPVRIAYQRDPDFFADAPPPWICFDEIHKRPKWKDILKGIYDGHQDRYRFVVIGSARLDTFRKSGDSLVGRYFHTHLFPLNLADFKKTDFVLPQDPIQLLEEAKDLADAKAFDDLLTLGGFPEPFFSGSEGFAKRWSINHQDLILKEDIRDLSRVVEVDKIESLLALLAPSIGNTVHYRKLGNDLETTHSNIRRWLEILNKVELIFSVSPYSKNIRRAYKQEKKWYYTDWRSVGQGRFENYIAASLWRAAVLYTDRFGEKMSLHYVRTHDGAEVDFLICKNRIPWLLVEAKEGAPEISSGVYRFSRELKVPCIITTGRKNFFKKVMGKEGQKIFCISWSKLGQVLP